MSSGKHFKKSWLVMTAAGEFFLPDLNVVPVVM
jgi:hypothetical protein